MRSNTFLFLLISFFLLPFIFFSNFLSAQIKKGIKPKHRSFYFSAGYNKEKYLNSTIKIDQPLLGNNYSLLKVKADYLTNVKALVPWQLNYRIGFYFNYDQTYGFEINYDPVNYHIANGENVQFKGTFDNQPNVNKTVPFYAKNGYYYGMDGANFLLLNFIRRYTIYRPNSNKLGVDAIAKIGAGPLMPHFLSSIPVNGSTPLSTFDDPQFRLKGWNAATELALRVTVYRYGYFEIAGKYDYAMYNNLKFYEGTAKQNLNTLEAILSLGFTFPSNRYNPLFHHEKKIITIIPFFLDKKMQDSVDKQEADQKRADGTESEQMQDVPEFGDLVDKRTRRENKRIADSIARGEAAQKIITDSIANKAMIDSIANQVITDSISNKRTIDSLAEKAIADSIAATMPMDSAAIKAPVDTTANKHEETKKERKARLKKEKEEQQKKEQELKDNALPDKKDNAEINGGDKDKKEQEQKDKEKKELDKQAEKDKKAAEKQAEKDKKAAEKQARKDKKAAEKKAREEEKEKARKEKEELKEKEKKDKEEKDKVKEEGK